MHELAAGEMSETSAIAESFDSVLFLPLHCIASRCFLRSSSFPDLHAKTAPCSEIA